MIRYVVYELKKNNEALINNVKTSSNVKFKFYSIFYEIMIKAAKIKHTVVKYTYSSMRTETNNTSS